MTKSAMNAPHTCPKCGATLPADAPDGLCPACLMSGGFDTDATVKMTPSQKPIPSQPAQTPSPQELAPLFPQLEIIELLGRGGMGAVYKARQPKLNRFVALKVISGDAAADPHFAERFQREAQALAKLNHPNIVSVFDFGMVGAAVLSGPQRTEDSPPHLYYFLMEFVDGANLRTLMQSGEMKPEAALALIPSFCDALQYAHDEGVVHRDIKPENVLVDKKGRLKIADFGLAKLTGSDAHDHTLTRTGMYLGTPRYMAPEQVEKPETVDHRADIYSLGVVFYEMLTGELPLGRFDPPSKKVQVDVKLDDIVLRSLEKEPARRYQHASEIKTDVQGVTGKTPVVPALTPGMPENGIAAPDPRLSRAALIGAIWALLGLIAVIPSLMLSKTVALSEGRPSSLVFEQPPVAFTVCMAVLLFIGAGAPIGTTILGAVSMGNIKRSGGKLYGLPLAFADTVFFPMLLLHGAMAVMLGVLVLSLLKMTGASAGLGALEMALLAMLPLIADFFIVRALWRKVSAGHTPVERSPSQPVSNGFPRLIVAGIVIGAAVIGAVLWNQTGGTNGGLRSFIASSTPRIEAENMGAMEPGHYRYRYQIHTPPDHRVLVWMETTRNGKPVVIPGLANNISTSTQLSIGERFDGDTEFSLMEGSRITPESKGKWRWDFKHGTVGKNTHRIAPGGWIDDPFAGMSTSVHQGPKIWEPKPGEEVSILVIRGGSHSYSRDPTEEPPAGEIELRLKARIDPVPLFHRVQGSINSSLRDPFPTPPTPLGRIAAGFRIDPKLPEDEIRRQMITELVSNDSKRTNAEAILKSVGRPVTHETKPEDVLKALEQLAQEQKPSKAPADEKPASNAAALLRQASEKYGALSTLGVTGKIVAEVAPIHGGASKPLESTFSINLARPEYYRVEWKQPLAGGVVQQGAAWSSGTGHRLWTGGKVSEWLDREQALGTATGVSGGAAHIVPSLFFKDEGTGLHELLANATLLPDESVGGDLCHVIAGDGPGGKHTLWITKKDLLLKQIRFVQAASSSKTPDAGAISPETMTKIATALGTDSTPEAVGKMTKEIEAQAQRVAALQVTSTLTCERIVANELMIKEDFEFTMPSAGKTTDKP